MYRVVRWAGPALLLSLPLGCKGTDPPASADLKVSTQDLSMGGGGMDGPPPPPDMRVQDLAGADLKVDPDLRIVDMRPIPDLFMPDMKPPTLEPRPACPNESKTSGDVYTISVAKCAGGGTCHVGGAGNAGGLNLGMSGAEMRTKLVGVNSFGSPMKLVTASDLNNSYLLYKILDLQSMAGGGGVMPQVGTMNDTEKCVFINWVRTGANN